MFRTTISLLALMLLCPTLVAAQEKTLFDFAVADELRPWSNLELPGVKEPAAKIETDKGRLKITFAGGRWPTITKAVVPDDWMQYHTFKATVTVSRPCLIGFTVLQEKSSRAGGWDGTVSRWVKTVLAQPGKNEVSALLHPDGYSISPKLGKVVRFEIFMYNPNDGESISVENIRLTSAKEVTPPVKTEFRVLGTDMKVSGVIELGKKLKDAWKPPTPKTVDEIEAEFRATFDDLKKKHPRAILATFRDGENGYAGWKNAYWSSHGPDGMTIERSTNFGKSASQEMFMRHRSPLMRVELGSIPAGANILAARLIIVRANDFYEKERDPRVNSNMWVAEACGRPWEEQQVNAYEYASNKFWRNYGGTHWAGEDPDFLPIYLAYGPGGGAVSSWDFTEAVKFWTGGKQVNHGFMLHGDARDWMSRAHYRTATSVRNRPGLLVIYEGK